MARKDEEAQNKYDSLLLNIVQSTDKKVDKLDTKLAKQGVELKANTRETALLKTEVRRTNGNVKELQTKVVDISKVVFPETSPNAFKEPVPPSKLKVFLKDPIVLRVLLLIVMAVTLVLLGWRGNPVELIK